MTSQIQPPSEWRRLFHIAVSLIDQVNKDQRVIDHWTIGGGTAIMLQIDHRESHDIDIFLPDPAVLRFLNPEIREFDLEAEPIGHFGDGTGFEKFSFEFGEIDFIAALALTESPAIQAEVEGVGVLLETVAEIITKKIYHRGSSIRPRDIFDIAAAGRTFRDDVIQALKSYPVQVARAISRIEKLNPDFVLRANSALMIKDEFADLTESALKEAKHLLASV